MRYFVLDVNGIMTYYKNNTEEKGKITISHLSYTKRANKDSMIIYCTESKREFELSQYASDMYNVDNTCKNPIDKWYNSITDLITK